MKKIIPLSKTELAYVSMVMEEHAALIRNADNVRGNRLSPLIDEKGIPRDAAINVNGQALEYEGPDIEQVEEMERLDAEAMG